MIDIERWLFIPSAKLIKRAAFERQQRLNIRNEYAWWGVKFCFVSMSP
jgi:hypothetical protein